MNGKNLWNKIKQFVREFISKEELIILMVVAMVVSFHYVLKYHEQKKKERLMEMLPPPPIDPAVDKRLEYEKNAENSLMKNMDAFYEPYLVDSLCRFVNEEKTQGFVTLSKKAPKYQDLISPEKNYYIWIQSDKYFPMGQLLRITKVAQNEELIQFHFVIDGPQDILTRLTDKMDSLKTNMERVSNAAKKE